MKWRRRVVMVVLAVAVAAAVVYGFLPRPVAVELAAVARGPLQVTVEQEGKTRVVDRYAISSPVDALAKRLELDVGDTVKQGQPLLELEPLRPTVLDPRSRAQAQARVSAAQASLKEAKSTVRAATADADFATAELERLEELFASGTVSRGVLDQGTTAARRAVATKRSAEFAVEVARFEVEVAKTALRHSATPEDDEQPLETVVLKSPVGGRVLKVYRESAGVVRSGQELIEVGDPRALEVEADVLSSDAVRIRPGSRVLFERWGGDEPLEGKVRLVEPVGFTKISALGVEEQRVLVIADFASPPARWERLGDGYRVEAKFVLWESDDVLQIPSSALFRYQDGWAVFVADEETGTARRREVAVGHRSALHVEVVSGLAEGEQVITHPDDEVDDGVAVERRRKSAAGR